MRKRNLFVLLLAVSCILTATACSTPVPANYCAADGCDNEGTQTYMGISGKTEYYCATHYDALHSTMDEMEEDD